MTGIVFPNIANSLLPLIQMDQQARRDSENMLWQRQKSDEDRAFRQQEAEAARTARQQEREDAQAARREMFDLQRLDRLDAQNRLKLKDQADWQATAADAVLTAPPEKRGQIYNFMLEEGKAKGYDLGRLPGAYSPDMDSRLDFYRRQAKEIAGRLASEPTPMGLPGGQQPQVPDLRAKGGEYVNYLTSKYPISPVAAAGIVGGLGWESGFNPNATHDGGRGYGFAGWDPNRTAALKAFATKTGRNFSDPQTQLDFVMEEMKGGDMGAQRAAAMLQNAKTPEEATTAMMHYFRPQGYTPANPNGGLHYAQRVQLANQLMPGQGAAPGGPAMPSPGPQMAQGDNVTGPPVGGPPGAGMPDMTTPMGVRAWVARTFNGARVLGVQGQPLYDKQGRLGVVMPDGTQEWVEVPKMEKPKGMFGDGESSLALQHLVNQGIITKDQAAMIAAGKVVTDPSTGAVTFMPPTALVGQGMPGASTAPAGGPAPAPQAAPGAAPAAPQSAGVPITPPKPEKMTEDQAKAAGFSDRMMQAEAIISANEGAGRDPGQKMSEYLPLAGNYFQTPQYQKLMQAKRNFINAQLRRESGAVIGPSEFAEADKQYFPQPGDTAEVLQQKAENRRTAIEAMKRSAGNSYKPTPAETAKQGFDLKKKYGLD